MQRRFDLKDCLPEELAAALDDPQSYLLPKTERPERRRGSKVYASEQDWFEIVKAGYDRGLFIRMCRRASEGF